MKNGIHIPGVPVTWEEFQNWYLWQIAAALELDRAQLSEDEMQLVDDYMKAAARPPSADRRG